MLTGGNFSGGSSVSGSSDTGARLAEPIAGGDSDGFLWGVFEFLWVLFCVTAIILTPIALTVWSIRVIFGS